MAAHPRITRRRKNAILAARMRLAELMGTLSLATDAGMGMPAEHGLRAAALAIGIGEAVGATHAERSDAFYLALLRYVGCTSDSDIAAEVMGDEVVVRGALYGVDWAAPTRLMPRFIGAIARGKGPVGGVTAAVRAMTKMPKLMGTAISHCEVGDRLAARVGFDGGFRGALFQTFERFDGGGFPQKLRGDAIALPMRIAQLAEEIEVGHRQGGALGARALVKQRRKQLDPRLVDRFDSAAVTICAALDAPSAWTAALAVEPAPHRVVDQDAIDEVLRVMADFADLKSRFTRTHSRGVADLAGRAARQLGLGASLQQVVERAGLVHDLGRVAVSISVWDKPGPLTDPEWERVRMHTYVGERILARLSSLSAVTEIASLAHERVDGRGYHRKLVGPSCPVLARILAAADVYHAMIEDRAHRRAHGEQAAAAMLAAEANRGALCPDAVAAVLAAAGHAPTRRAAGPAGLTDRERAVLRLVARGLTNKEVAVALDISTKTAGHHVQHIFEKIGVTTRAAASMFAMQHGLVA